MSIIRAVTQLNKSRERLLASKTAIEDKQKAKLKDLEDQIAGIDYAIAALKKEQPSLGEE